MLHTFFNFVKPVRLKQVRKGQCLPSDLDAGTFSLVGYLLIVYRECSHDSNAMCWTSIATDPYMFINLSKEVSCMFIYLIY